MPGDDVAPAVGQHRIGPAELDHAGRDLCHLGIRMGPRIAAIWNQPVDGPRLDRVGKRMGHGHFPAAWMRQPGQ